MGGEGGGIFSKCQKKAHGGNFCRLFYSYLYGVQRD